MVRFSFPCTTFSKGVHVHTLTLSCAKSFNSFGWEFSVFSSRGRKRRSSNGSSSIHLRVSLHLVCLIFLPKGAFRRNAAWTEKRIGKFDGLYFYYEKTKRERANQSFADLLKKG